MPQVHPGIESALTGVPSVSKACIVGEGEEQKLVVEHAPGTVAVEQLIDVLKTLPSFYEGFFIPTVIGNPEKKS